MRNYFEGSFDFKMSVKADGMVCSDIIISFPLALEQLKLWNMFKDDLCQEIIHITQQRDQDFYA